MNFNMHHSVDKTGYFLDSLITRKSLKLGDDVSNQFRLQKYLDIINSLKFDMYLHKRIKSTLIRLRE